MRHQPELGIAGHLTPALQGAWDEQLREAEQVSSAAELAEWHYRATTWLAALVQARVIATNAATPLRDARDRAHRHAEQRLAIKQS